MTFRLISDDAALFAQAKWAFSTRRVDRAAAAGLSRDFASAVSGDLVLGRIVSIAQHAGVQLAEGRRSLLYPGDLVVAACGARYAPDQFEGVAEINAQGAHMLAGGGCVGRMIHRNEKVKPPTKLIPLGLITDAAGATINIADYALPPSGAAPSIPVIGVFGASMNSGKTTATAALAYGLRRAGWSVAAMKGTGTGAFGDFHKYEDTGARYVGDFTDAGMVSTYKTPLDRVKAGVRDLFAAAARERADVAVLEIADGVFQRETAALLADAEFRSWFAGAIFACGDPLAAAGGVGAMADHGLRPAALTGVLSCSPMSAAEAVEATGVRVLSKSQLEDPAEAGALLNALASPRIAAA
ncbi:MAG: DUF1611 domain-containing protein [Pseudomonadota bacterium]